MRDSIRYGLGRTDSTGPIPKRSAQLIRRAAIAMLVAIFASPSSAQEAPQGAASGIEQQYRSRQTKPGDDFYRYINDGWLETTKIPEDQSNYGSFSVLDDANKALIRKLIEEAAGNPAATGPAAQVGSLYRSYVDLEGRNQKGLQPIAGWIRKIRAIESKSQWAEMAGQLSRVGIGGFFGMGVEPDARKSDQYAVYMGQSGTTLPDRDYYLKEEGRYAEARAALQQYAQSMFQSAGHPDPAKAAQHVIDLETLFAKAQWEKVLLRDPVKNYNKMQVDQVKQLLSKFDWDAYSRGMDYQAKGSLIVGQPSFFEEANQIFEKASLESLNDFLLFSLIDHYAPALDQGMVDRHFAFHETALSGVTEQKPLWRRGVEICNGRLGMPVGQMYVDASFSKEAKTRMEQLVANLKTAFAKRIENLAWMGNGTKQQALEKLSKFTTKIGYPDRWKDYSSVQLKPDDLVGNLDKIAQFEHHYELAKMGKPIDRTEWFMPPQIVNAYYNPLMNEIVFPAAILQPPFFNLQADDAVNYGGIGAVIGHEISHGFDDSGSQFDGDGNLRNWWTEKDREEFERRSEQLVTQYSQYKPFPDMAVNGKFTLGENIGDLGGMAVAYDAYQLSLGGNPSPMIDGMTGDQRFFAGWAQVWRRKYRETELRKRLLTDPHSPSQYRCNGILSNIDKFYEAFAVQPGDPMYIEPEKRVRIW